MQGNKEENEHILLIDFGSQVTQLIARLVREAGTYCKLVPYDKAQNYLESKGLKAIILSGSPASVGDKKALWPPAQIFEMGLPVLGICYGQQVMSEMLGGVAEPSVKREYGATDICLAKDSPLFEEIGVVGSTHRVWMSHGDKVIKLAEGFLSLATSDNSPFAAIANEEKKFYGVQFHPEVAHTPLGKQLIRNFIHNITNAKKSWNMESFREKAIAAIKAQVKGEKVLCALSGGVDSAVTAKLIHEAIGKNLVCVFVDNGLLRHGEREQVSTLTRNKFNIPLIVVEAEAEFLLALKGVSDPEKKRKIIGKTFIDIFEREAKKISGAKFLAQGTLYPDVIESVSVSGAPSHLIKSHHNVGGLPARMNMELVEPLRELFKDEVRVLGNVMGLPNDFISRHPFPGPGLAIRILGEVKKADCDLLRDADAIFLEEIKKHGLYDEIWQAFAVLLPWHSVGVMGDARAYDRIIALRAITSSDGMTADVYHFTPDFLTKISARIVNEVKGIGRVVYDISSKPPSSIEWE